MMKKIVLCEGKTDAILLSYFLNKQYNWLYTKQPVNLDLPFDRSNEVLNWYKNDTNLLAIWGVGGIDSIPQKLKKVIDRNSFERDKKTVLPKLF